MLLLEAMETVGGVWLALSAIAFTLGAAFVNTRQEASESALEASESALESVANSKLMMDGRQASPDASPVRKLNKAKKRPASKPSSDLAKAA